MNVNLRAEASHAAAATQQSSGTGQYDTKQNHRNHADPAAVWQS